MIFRDSKRFGSACGTVSLVALCFVAVLGISLAGYIMVCSRAMALSNRSFQGNLSQQLAELGLEEALRAFNKNDWSDWSNGGVSVNWDTTTYSASKRAVATLTFASGKFAQGTTATVKIRVDNYDAAQLGAAWSNATTHRINDLVGHNGVWYRSVQNGNSNHAPGTTDLAWWVPAPITWAWSSNTSYTANESLVCYNGSWQLCDTTHVSSSNFDSSKWTAVSAPNLAWSAWTWYGTGQLVFLTSDNTWYRCTSGHFSFSWDSSKFVIASWSYQAATTYSFNDAVSYNGSWYRFINGTAASGITPGSNSSYWENALSGTNTTSNPGPHGWSSSNINYNARDTVYYNGRWYRCIKAHASSASITPTDATYWTNTPLFSTAWDSAKQYSQNDTARHNGVWYLSLKNSNVAQNPSTASTYWIGADTSNASYTWNPATNYTAGAYRCYGGVWYKCLVSHTNKSPNDPAYWTAAWSNSWGITTGAPVAYAEATAFIPNNPAVRTQLRAPLAPAPLFPNAAGATADLTITTGTGTVDSYDSEIGAYGGANLSHSAVLAAGSTLAIKGTTAVKGYLAWPSPPSGISTETTVKGPASPVSPNVDKTRVSPSPYIPVFDTLPSGDLATYWTNLPKGTTVPATLNNVGNLGTPGATAPSRYNVNGSLQLGSSENLATLNINGPVILYINGNLRLRSGGGIYINSSASAEIHLAGQLIMESGNNGLVNRAPSSASPDPKNLILIAHTTASTALSYSYASILHGVIYAPYTTHSNGLVINSGVTIYGALSAREITFSSEANLHYDTSLRYATFGGVDQPYAISEWRELPAVEFAPMP